VGWERPHSQKVRKRYFRVQTKQPASPDQTRCMVARFPFKFNQVLPQSSAKAEKKKRSFDLE
jgi:hypothetical protein